MIGDSFTFGMGVDLGDTYVKQLQQQLRLQDQSFDVINFGVVAYQVWQYLEVLEQRVYNYEPDLVVFGFFADDISVAAEPPDRNPEGRDRFNDPYQAAFTGSHLLNVLRNVIRLADIRAQQRQRPMTRSIADRQRMIGPKGANGKPHGTYLVLIGEIESQTLTDFETALERLAQSTRAQGIPVLLLYIPDSTQLGEPKRQALNKVYLDITQKLELDFLDLTPQFEAEPDPETLYLFPFDGHTSPQGNRRIADAIAAHPLVRSLLQADNDPVAGLNQAFAP